MDIKRICRHLLMTHWQVNRAFPAAARDAIAAATSARRSAHVGQVHFAVEGALHVRALFKGQTAQQRALEVFSHLRVWDTEHNNGLLIYLLLADRAVEIVADRGAYSRVDPGEWGRICRQMEAAFKQQHYEAGVIAGIQAATQQLIQHFPAPAA
ncbi:MAG TPA: TPM domain-containing protein [Steroidobacteraceae bacterium]|jgi:uncharacterized membrane protein|nr:TPM domain-containing protein [Steroidobacteraceae bacterium]